MATKPRQFVIHCILFLVLAYRKSAETCTLTFNFLSPVTKDARLTAMENTVLNITFWLDYDGCKNEYFPVSVRKEDRDSTECQLRLYRDGSCNGNGNCYCDTKNRKIMFSRFVNASDAGNWLWMTMSGHSTIEKVLFFDVTSAPHPTTSSRSSSAVVSATSSSPHSEDKTGARFQFPTLADGHTVNAREGDIITLPFTIKREKQCKVPENFVLKVTKVADTSPLQCVLFHKNGSCQDQDQGKADTKCTCNSQDRLYRLIHKVNNLPAFWVWSATGDSIQDHNITFHVAETSHVTDLAIYTSSSRAPYPQPVLPNTSLDMASTTPTRPAEKDSQSTSTLTHIANVAAGVLIVGIVFISVTIIYVKKVSVSRGEALQPVRQGEYPVLQLPVLPALLDDVDRSSTESENTSHTYQEVADEPEQIPMVPVHTTRHCRAPRDAPDGYLQPSPSLPERINTMPDTTADTKVCDTASSPQERSGDSESTLDTTQSATHDTSRPERSHSGQHIYENCNSIPV